MRLIRTSVLAILLATVSSSFALAAEFYVKPLISGPVTAPALAALSIPAGSVTGTSTTTAAAGSTTTTGTTTVSTSVSRTTTTTETAGKWVSVADTTPDTPTAAAPSTTTASTATTASTTAGAAIAPANTFPSFVALMNSGQLKGGDRVFLMDGYHGPIVVRGQQFTSPVLITSMPGATAQADSILVDNSSNIVFQGIKVWASSPGKSMLIRSYPNTQNIVFTGLDVRALSNSTDYRNWTVAELLNNKRTGFLADGVGVTVSKNRLTGLQNGILTLGDNALIEGNIVDGFTGDGMRALGDNNIVRGNLVQNCLNIDANHRDGFQSYSTGPTGKPGTGTLMNLTIENNRIFEWVGAPNPLSCKLQGIGMFDGMFDGTLIQNNLIVVSAYHGISVAGALNSTIRQNTVVNTSGAAAKSPWILVAPHKNGTPSRNDVIVNNLASNIITSTNPATGIVVANNVRAGAASNEFTAFAQQDLSLKATSTGVDAGDPKYTTPTDVMGIKRWLGKGPDAGAYESR